MGRASSTEHRLLVLGLLQMQELHGYQLAEIIESHFSSNTHIKKATLYDTLKRLHAEGLVTSREEQQGNRPLRTVYALTPEGDEAFLVLLHESIATYHEPAVHDDTALMFLHVLPPAEALELLQRRRESVAAALDERLQDDSHHGSLDTLVSRRRHHLRAEAAWLEEVIAQLAK